MKLSTKARYATRILTHIAVHESHGPVQKHHIAKDEILSSDYVEQILVSLRNAGLVNSHRGAKGGFTIAKSASNLTVMNIIQATDGPLSLAPCSDGGPSGEKCPGSCITHPIWAHASELLTNYFQKITIKDLAERYKQQKQETIDYQI